MPEHRIMILEDEAIIAWDIEAELQSRGLHVVGVAGQVSDAVALLDTGGITVAILDINVGREKSFDLAQTCRNRGIAVIFLTGDSGDDRPAQLNDCEIVAKPVNYNILMAALQRLDD